MSSDTRGYIVWYLYTSIFLFIVLILVFGSPAMAILLTTDIDWTVHEKVVSGLEAQISLIKWIGVPVCTSLCGTVAILWRANLRKERMILDEVKAAREERQKLAVSLDRLVGVLAVMDKKIEACPERGRSSSKK